LRKTNNYKGEGAGVQPHFNRPTGLFKSRRNDLEKRERDTSIEGGNGGEIDLPYGNFLSVGESIKEKDRKEATGEARRKKKKLRDRDTNGKGTAAFPRKKKIQEK